MLPGVTATLTDRALVVESSSPLSVLSSAVVGGGFRRTHHIVNYHVPRTYDSIHPQVDLVAFARDSGIPRPFIGLMTAVPMDRTHLVTKTNDGITAAVLATVGLDNLASPGFTIPASRRPGTINLIVLLDAALTPSALVNALTLITEAKTLWLLERSLTATDGHWATGTSTDAVAIACTRHGQRVRYAGPATPVGWLLGRCVREVLEQSRDSKEEPDDS